MTDDIGNGFYNTLRYSKARSQCRYSVGQNPSAYFKCYICACGAWELNTLYILRAIGSWFVRFMAQLPIYSFQCSDLAILSQTNVYVKAIHPTPDFIERSFLDEFYKRLKKKGVYWWHNNTLFPAKCNIHSKVNYKYMPFAEIKQGFTLRNETYITSRKEKYYDRKRTRYARSAYVWWVW